MGEMANRMLSVPLATLVTCSDGGGTGEVPLLPLLGPYKDVMLIAQSSVYSDDSMRSLCKIFNIVPQGANAMCAHCNPCGNAMILFMGGASYGCRPCRGVDTSAFVFVSASPRANFSCPVSTAFGADSIILL